MECEVVKIDGAPDPNGQKTNGPDQPGKSQKRKRSASLIPEVLGATTEEKEARIVALRTELEGLFGFYKEVTGKKAVDLDIMTAMQCRSGANALVAALMEESDLPLSKLVEEIHGEVAKAKEKGVCCEGLLTVASVKSTVVFVGQRVMYGVSNADADVLEDDSHSCLWCWETRDLKLLPQSVRGVLNIRRTCRKRIHERITAVSEMIAALQKSEGDHNYKHDLRKASDKLGKAHNEADIRLLVEGLMQKNGANQVEKEAKREEKLLTKQLERDKREAEKEKKRLEMKVLKEKLQSEKEQKRLQEEAEKDERRREREESETRRQLRKQQEEAEKDRKRREKEETELKKQLSIKKQASIMERFIKRSKTTPIQSTHQSSTKETTNGSLSKGCGKLPNAVTQSMDCTLSSSEDISVEDITKSHLAAWRCLGRSIRSNRNQHWGLRRKPKSKLFKELKLTTSRPSIVVIDELNEEKHVDGCGECVSDDRSCRTNASCSVADVKKLTRAKQLLQFDKSFRPAFYGIWPKKSHVVGPRHPLRKDPDLDYDIDSDEEWEEEEPGESLSDCDKDDEDESLQDGCSKADDEDESEDGFFVPDGYLSENEGVQVDRMETDITAEEAKSSPGLESEEFCALLRQQKCLSNLTDHALRKNQPLIISNLMHEKAFLLISEGLSGTPKLEQMCLRALSMCLFPGSSPVEISLDNVAEIDQEACTSSGNDSTTPTSTTIVTPELDLHKLVSAIQSCPQGIHKLAESLQQKFPAFSKSQLRNKVRAISDYADNRWQVKKEVLEKLGLTISPGGHHHKLSFVLTPPNITLFSKE
ncbi:hypothetical protein L484_011785 [Morus notabilis]|uniref:Chromatin assembly factor 1 subunit FAS1 n=1 Tax=Morus notabilis TaxID=981085 RepID=W9SEC3_9ROSA|nr:hypothetical protein L484_011785 [Morus notabilis]